MSLQEDLNRVRNLRASKIPAHTRQVALLNGVESLLKEENQELNATAYFAALLSLLSRPDAAEPATELLAYIVPHVHKPLLASKIDVTISKLLPILLEDASTAHTRSAIAVLEAILISVDHTAWQVPLSELGAQGVAFQHAQRELAGQYVPLLSRHRRDTRGGVEGRAGSSS